MAGGVADIDKGFQALLRDLTKLSGAPVSVLVGVSGKKDSDVVIYAASNEYGTDDGHVPERSYLRSTIDDNQAEILDDLQDAIAKALRGAAIDTQLGRVGEKWVGRVKETIASNVPPPNAVYVTADGSEYVRKRFAPGGRVPAASARTLIDSTRLRNAITWELDRGSK